MVAIKLQKYEEGASDSTKAIELDPSFLKAWQRRAACRKELGQVLDAAQDFEEALRFVCSDPPFSLTNVLLHTGGLLYLLKKFPGLSG